MSYGTRQWNDERSGNHAFADMKTPLKRRKDADEWIDSSVKKAILVDKTNKITLLKNE